MTILIIGSKGFIGKNLKNYFESRGHVIFHADVVVDYKAGPNYFLIDASNADFGSVFRSQRFDVCINCSGAASVPQSLEWPGRDFSLNTSNVFNILDSIRMFQPKCLFINFSSAAVYGNPDVLPIPEDLPPRPMSPYGIHKLMSEQICQEFYHFFNIRTCSLRVFSAYGEGLTKQLFWDIAQKANVCDSIDLFGTGRESRDFIYIDDLAEAVNRVILNGSFNGEAINVATGSETTIRQAVDTFLEVFEKPIKVHFRGEERPGDPINWRADTKKIGDLGFRPKFSLHAGLSNYVRWLNEEEYLTIK